MNELLLYLPVVPAVKFIPQGKWVSEGLEQAEFPSRVRGYRLRIPFTRLLRASCYGPREIFDMLKVPDRAQRNWGGELYSSPPVWISS